MKVTIVGIGEDGIAGLTNSTRSVIASADILVGGERHLAMVETTGKTIILWQKPISKTIDEIKNYTDRAVCVLASGDPMWYGIGKMILQAIPEALVIPALSSFSLACSRLGWSMEDVDQLSLCGRPVSLLTSYLAPGRHLLVLGSDQNTVYQIGELLKQTNYDSSRLTILSNLGGEKERIISLSLSEARGEFPALSVIAIECLSNGLPLCRSRLPGLPDRAYRHDGQLTKSQVRAITLAALAPAPGELLWDIGAGCGSISIEWLRSHPLCRAIAIEPTRIDYIAENAQALGVPHLQIVQGKAPEALDGLPTPQAIFIGGGITTPNLVEICWQSLPTYGRLIANAVTLESQALVYRWQQQLGGTLTRISIENAEPIGNFRIWKSQAPIVQWSVMKQPGLSPADPHYSPPNHSNH